MRKNHGTESGFDIPSLIGRMAILFWLTMLPAACGGSGGGSANLAATEVVTVVGMAPGSGTDQVAVNATISAAFSAAMDPATLNGDTFQVNGPDGPISGTVSYNPSTRTTSFTPTAPLMPLASYTATLTTGAKTNGGQPFSGNFSWQFTTARDALVRPASGIVPDTFFGMHIHRATTTTAWPVVPFKTWRLWDAYVAWPNLEPSSGTWDFTTLDAYVAMAEQHNVEIVLPLGLSPRWASARPTEPSAYGPGNAAEPANLSDWINYVSTVTNRYKGRIHYYELWNEVNIPGFYSGTVDEMLTLAQTAYQTLKAIDPSITFLSPSCVANNNSRVAWFAEYLQKGGGQYADVLDYHFYVSPNAPEAMVPFIGKISQIIAANGLSNKPLWNTESGWYIQNRDGTVASSGSLGVVVSYDQGSAYVARSYVLNWASGIDRFCWYAWDNYETGLVESDGVTLKPPAIAYGQVQAWLAGARMMSCGQNSQGTWVVMITKANGRNARIVWNAGQTLTMQVPLEWKALVVKDLAGNSTSVTAGSQISVGLAPVLIES